MAEKFNRDFIGCNPQSSPIMSKLLMQKTTCFSMWMNATLSIQKFQTNSKNFLIVTIKQKNTEQPSYLFCRKIYYMHDRGYHEMVGKTFDHHLMFYNGKKLIFKVWLPNDTKDKKFKNAKEALKSVGMEIQI